MKIRLGPPIDRVLTVCLLLSFALTLVSSVLYTARGWDDSTAALFHIVGGVLGALAVVRLVAYLDDLPALAAAALAVGLVGCGGVVGYGFNTVEVGLHGVDLIHAPGAAAQILKPLGLCWPLALLLIGLGLLRAGRVPVWCGLGIAVAAVAFPISRIANIGWLAVTVDVVLLGCLAAVPAIIRDAADMTATAAEVTAVEVTPRDTAAARLR